LRELFLDIGREVKQILETIHKFNTAFVITSTGCKLNDRLAHNIGQWSFLIHQYLYYTIGLLGVAECATVAWAQHYLNNVSTVVEENIRPNSDLNQIII
jgi:hypothetical protein